MPPTTQIPARFRPLADIAFVTGRPYRTIQTWVRRERIESMKHPRTGLLLADLVAADQLSKATGRRTHRAA